MSEYVTLDKMAPEFDSYLRGTFSKTKRALPIKSLNVNSDQERVTFQVINTDDIKKPGVFVIWLKTLKVRSYLIVLFPMFYVLARNIVYSSVVDVWTTLFSTLGILFLYTALVLRNDFVDHMKGFDRIDQELGSRPIQLGWLRAESVRKAANSAIGISLLFAAVVFLAFPTIILFVGLAALIGYLTLFRMKSSFKEMAGGELGILLLVGPMLASGYELSVAGLVRTETIFFGLIWGWMVLLPIHLRNLSLMVSQSQAGLNNLINYLGFDKGKKFLYFWWYIAVLLFVIFQNQFAEFYWFWFYSLAIILLSILFSKKLVSLESPVSSSMITIRRQGAYMLDTVMALWLIELAWSLFA